MKFECACGALIHDGAERNPRKAHLVPDQLMSGLLDEIDRAIEHPASTAAGREAQCMAIRSRLASAGRMIWQCAQCERLHVDGDGAKTHAFRPEDAAAADLLSARMSRD